MRTSIGFRRILLAAALVFAATNLPASLMESIPVSLSGPDTTKTSECHNFAATGGLPPYTISVLGNGASVDENGNVCFSSSACGSFTVMATDQSGETASITGRVTNSGQWVRVETCSDTSPSPLYFETVSYHGNFRYTVIHTDHFAGYGDKSPCCGMWGTEEYCNYTTGRTYVSVRIDEWQCPSSDRQKNLGSPVSPDEAEAERCNFEGLFDHRASNKLCLHSSSDLQSGDLYLSQQVGPIVFSYNSLDQKTGPLGAGWTHDYNVSLAVNADATLTVRGKDGGLSYFTKGADNIYRAGARDRDSSSIVKNPDNSFTRTTRYGKVYNFASSGKLTSIVDRNGNATTLTYSGNDLSGITDQASGRTVTIISEGGKIKSVSEPVTATSSRTYTISYWPSGLISSISDPLGNTWQYKYGPDNSGKMTEKADPNGNTVYYYYYSDGKLEHSTDPYGISKSIVYDPVNSTTTVTEKDGGIWKHKYNEFLNVPVTITDPFGYETVYDYDYSKNQLKSITYPDGTSESFTYDPDTGNVTSQTDRRNHTTTFIYDPDPQKGGKGIRVTEIQDPELKLTHITYDANGNIKTYTDRTNGTTQFLREDAKKNVTKIIDPLLHEFQFDYHDQNGVLGNRITSTTDPEARTTTYVRNKLGSVLTRTDNLNHTTTFGYEDDGELLWTVTDQLANKSTLGHDQNGNVDAVYDAAGNQPTTYKYNYRGDPTNITDARGNSTILTYAPAGCSSCSGGGEKITSITDALGFSTNFDYSYDYTQKLYVTTTTDPLAKAATSRYDLLTRQQAVTDRKGDRLTYAYSPTGKLETVTYPGGEQVNYIYDTRDRLRHVQDSVGQAGYIYDDEGRLTDYTDANGNTIHFLYDPAGNLQQVTYPDSSVATYTYYNDNRLEHVRNWLNETTYEEATYTYDAAGRPESFTNFNGIKTTYTFDDADRLTGIQSSVASYGFTLDPNGNRTESVQTEPLSATPALGSTTYTYNDKKNRLSTAGSTGYTYDTEGQLESAGGTVLSFNCDHRLEEITDGAATDHFSYDGIGNRIKAVRSGIETRYIYDPWGNLLAEADASNTITRKYIYSKGLIAMQQASGARYCYHFNGTGSTVALTDMTQAVVNSYAYEPFGKIIGEHETIVQPFKFVGQYGVLAEPNGLYYMRARYYDPNVGRFISEDPIGFSGGDVNLYAYVGNNPITRIDPLGLTQRDIDVAIALARSTQTDMHFPADEQYHVTTDMPISPATGKPASAYTDTSGTYLNADKYLPKLNDNQATHLLDTIIHEGVHWSLPWDDERQEDSCGKGYPYDEAKRRMTQELIKKYLKMRK